MSTGTMLKMDFQSVCCESSITFLLIFNDDMYSLTDASSLAVYQFPLKGSSNVTAAIAARSYYARLSRTQIATLIPGPNEVRVRVPSLGTRQMLV